MHKCKYMLKTAMKSLIISKVVVYSGKNTFIAQLYYEETTSVLLKIR